MTRVGYILTSITPYCVYYPHNYIISYLSNCPFFTVDPPKIIRHPESKTVATGADITMSVQATGDDLHYQWQKDCVNLSDDDRHCDTGTHTLRIVEMERSDNKARYRCHVRNEIGETFSKEALFKVGKLVVCYSCKSNFIDDLRNCML